MEENNTLNQEDTIKKILLFQVKRKIIMLYKDFLEILEDLGEDHAKMMEKLKKVFPEQEDAWKIEVCDYFDEEKYQLMRKKVLDRGNDCARDIEESFKQFKISV